jgi:hypothetical protein
MQPKVGKDFFLFFSYFKHLGASSLQAHQGHSYPWPFRLGLNNQKSYLDNLILKITVLIGNFHITVQTFDTAVTGLEKSDK